MLSHSAVFTKNDDFFYIYGSFSKILQASNTDAFWSNFNFSEKLLSERDPWTAASVFPPW